jgi:hypothetical protein
LFFRENEYNISVGVVNMLDKVKYWLDLCDEDMAVADLLIKGNKYLQAGFFCHLVAEKAL